MAEPVRVAPSERPANSTPSLTAPAAVKAACFLLLVVWTFVAGKDVSWDVLNHQLYLPFSWLNGRARTDYFGAGTQAYQNPLGYFPVYGLIRLGLPAWSIGAILACVHALVVWPLDRIARLFWPGTGDDFWMRSLALALSCITPVFLIHVGTTSIDPFTSLCVVWALALSLELEHAASGADGRRKACLAGALLGLASAAKLSNAYFAVALCALWLLKAIVGQADVRRLAAFALGLGVAFVVCAGPWMFWLWHDFGNPVFPLFNNLFHSPYAPQQAATALRFVPATWAGALVRLAELAELSKYVSFEAFVPDVRPLLAAVFAVGALAMLAARGGWRRLAAQATWRSPGVQLAFALVLMYVFWVRSSGNARYGMPLFVLFGVGLVRAAQTSLPAKGVKVVLLTILLLQSAYYFKEGNFRFEKAHWDSGPYLEYEVSPRLRDQPFLHLMIGTQTNAAIALFLDPRGAMSNPIGQLGLPLDGPVGRPLRTLLDQWHGRTRVLQYVPRAKTPADEEQVKVGLHAMLYRLGLDVDWRDCENVELRIDRSEQLQARSDSKSPLPDFHLESCAVLYSPQRDPLVDKAQADADRVFSIMEAACPAIFSPSPFVSEHGPGVWQRHYINTDAALFVSPAKGVYFAHFRMINGARFGTIDEVLSHRSPISCPQISIQTPQ